MGDVDVPVEVGRSQQQLVRETHDGLVVVDVDETVNSRDAHGRPLPWHTHIILHYII